MSSVKRCDACGAIGEKPFDGWLRIDTFERREVANEDDPWRKLHTRTEPVLSFEVCGHACLPELAFLHAEEFDRVEA